MLSKAQLDRYARHIILPQVGLAGQKRLIEARVLVVGAGGLGAPLLLYLAAAGVGTLGIVDDDQVELTNLQRQVLYGTSDLGQPKARVAQARLKALNPEISVEAYPQRLVAENARELIARYQLIIDGSDNLPTRYLLSDACVLEGKPLIYGAISQFEGQLSVLGAGGPCYRCLFPSPPPEGVLNCAEAGVFGVLPGVIGSLMATEALKLLLGVGEPLAGVLLHYDALYGETRRLQLRRNPDCPVCGDSPTVTALLDDEAFCRG
jgi:adenylyltransferase/sulfurtransferase